MGESGTSGLRDVVGELLAELGGERVIPDRQRRRTYECDGLAAYRVIPGAVVLARDAASPSHS